VRITCFSMKQSFSSGEDEFIKFVSALPSEQRASHVILVAASTSSGDIADVVSSATSDVWSIEETTEAGSERE